MIRVQAVFITGQSNPAICALSPIQRAFLDGLTLPPQARYPTNFPYSGGTDHRETPILQASLNNARLYRAARSPGFAAQYRPAFREILDRAAHTVFLAGSCGLELLSGLHLDRADLDRLSVFAYGPVARTVPACRVLLVQGRGDWISRWWFRKVDRRVPCGHMDYLDCPEVLQLCRDFVRKSERTLESR